MTPTQLGAVEYSCAIKDNDTADWRVRRIALHERLSDLYSCSLDVAHLLGDDDAEALRAALLGATCTLTTTRKNPDHSVRAECHLHGIVTRVVDRGIEGTPQYARATVEISPALWSLSKRISTRVFNDKTALEIVKQVTSQGLQPFERAELADRTRGHGYKKREYTAQMNETDLDFVMRLMQEEGVSFFFEHPAEGPEKLVLVDEITDYPSGVALDATATDSMLERFTPAAQLHSTTVITADVDWTQPSVPIVQSSGEDTAAHLEVYLPFISDEKQARIRRELVEAEANRIEGVSVAVEVRTGQTIDVTTDAGTRKYLVTDLRAAGTSTEDLGLGLDDVGGVAEYENSFSCLEDRFPFRPSRTVARPKVAGIQTAVVIGDEDVSTDSTDDSDAKGTGCVKVRFHWDRENKYSTWIRVLQPWAGTGFGAWFLPRVGMEVAVSFIDGNPDRPIIMGCLHNAEHPTPFVLPKEKTKSGIKTRTSAAGVATASGGNELVFEDEKGKEEIAVQAQRDMNTLVKNNRVTNVGSGASAIALSGEAPAAKPTGNDTLRVEGNYYEVIGGQKFIQVGNYTQLIKGNESWSWTNLFDFEGFNGIKATYTTGVVLEAQAGLKHEIFAAGRASFGIGAKSDVFLGTKHEFFAGTQYEKTASSRHSQAKEEITSVSGEDHVLRGGKRLALIGGGTGLSAKDKTKLAKEESGWRAFGTQVLFFLGALTAVGGLYAAVMGAIGLFKKSDAASEAAEKGDQIWKAAKDNDESRIVLDGDSVQATAPTEIRLTVGAAAADFSDATWMSTVTNAGDKDSNLWVAKEDAGINAGKALVAVLKDGSVLIQGTDKIFIATDSEVVINAKQGVSLMPGQAGLRVLKDELTWSGTKAVVTKDLVVGE